jgi:Domain of unknown function DUF11
MTHLVRWAHRVRFGHTRRAALALTTLGLSLALVAAFLVVGPTFAAPPSPSITLSPSAAVPGASVSVSGANFGCKSVDLAFDTTSVGTATVTKKAFSASVTIPSAATAGQHMVTASCGGHNGSAQATFTVLSRADLSLRVIGPDFLSYPTLEGACSITVANLGPDPAINAVVRISIEAGPAGLLYAFGVNRVSAGSYDPATMTWAIGAMSPYTHETLDCTLTVDIIHYTTPPTPYQVRTTVVVSSSTNDPLPTDNTNGFWTNAV